MRVDIVVDEGYSNRITLASMNKSDDPNLASGSLRWTIDGISPDHENLIYQIRILAWNIEGDYAEAGSQGFHIVDHIEKDKWGKEPRIEDVSAEASHILATLPGFTGDQDDQERDHYWVFPPTYKSNNGCLSFRLRSCRGKSAIVESIELISLDVAKGLTVTLHDGELQLTRDGERFLPITSYLEGSPEQRALCDNIILSAKTLKHSSDGLNPAVDAQNGIVFDFSVPVEVKEGTRVYILSYRGFLVDSDDAEEEELPIVFALKDPYPNPFNPAVTIPFDVPSRAHIVLCVYSPSGMLIRTLVDQGCRPGMHKVAWDGTNTEGKKVASGVYFCRLIVNDETSMSKKLVFLR
jgi:hypothetical protein